MLPSARAILGSSQLYRSLEGDVAERLASICRVYSVAKGTQLFCIGDECPGVFIVHSGQIRLSQTAASGKTHVMRFAGPGQSFAEAAVLGEFASPVQADSSEPTVLLQIPADSLRELLERDHELTLAMLRAISLRQRAVVRHTSDIALRDACGRLASYVCEQLEEQSKAASAAGVGAAKVRLAMQKQDLARHLNLTSETLSRVLRKLMEEGVLSPPGASQDEICVADRRALEELAELPSR